MKILKITIAALLVLAAASLAGVGRPEAASSASDNPREGITVTGTGHAKTVPDEAEFSLGVTTKGETAQAALSRNSARMERLIEALKSAGVAERDIKTQHVSVGRGYDQSGQESGYSAHNTVSVLIRDLGQAGAVLDAAARAGANDVYGPSLSRSGRESFEAKALKDAVANARTRAKALAEAAGVSLGEVTAITESSQPQPGPWMEMATAGRAVGDAKAPIEPGTEEITAVVTVTFALGG